MAPHLLAKQIHFLVLYFIYLKKRGGQSVTIAKYVLRVRIERSELNRGKKPLKLFI